MTMMAAFGGTLAEREGCLGLGGTHLGHEGWGHLVVPMAAGCSRPVERPCSTATALTPAGAHRGSVLGGRSRRQVAHDPVP